MLFRNNSGTKLHIHLYRQEDDYWHTSFRVPRDHIELPRNAEATYTVDGEYKAQIFGVIGSCTCGGTVHTNMVEAEHLIEDSEVTIIGVLEIELSPDGGSG